MEMEIIKSDEERKLSNIHNKTIINRLVLYRYYCIHRESSV